MLRVPVVLVGLGLVAGGMAAGDLIGSQHDAPSAGPTVQAAAAQFPAGNPTLPGPSASPSLPAASTVTATATVTATVTRKQAAPKPRTDTVKGEVRWTMFIGSDLAQTGDDGPACGARDGAVNIMNSSNTVLTVHQAHPVVTSRKTDRHGDVTTSCAEDYSVRVPASPVYGVTFTNPPSNDNATETCKTDMTRLNTTANTNSAGVAHMQPLSWFFGCY